MAGEDKGVHTFPKGINLKVNLKMQLEFELTYYDVTAYHVCHMDLPTFLEQ